MYISCIEMAEPICYPKSELPSIKAKNETKAKPIVAIQNSIKIETKAKTVETKLMLKLLSFNSYQNTNQRLLTSKDTNKMRGNPKQGGHLLLDVVCNRSSCPRPGSPAGSTWSTGVQQDLVGTLVIISKVWIYNLKFTNPLLQFYWICFVKVQTFKY